MPTSDIAIVILNYNGRHFLEQFLSGVIAHSPQAEVVIIDNASKDDSRDWLQNHFPEIRCIALPENLGFAGGYNAGLAYIEAKYWVLLNSDVAVSPHWLEPLQDFLDQHPRVAACQPKILSQREPEHFEYAGAAGGFIDYLGYPFCRGRIFETIESDEGQYNDYCEVFWATGACLMIRSEVFWELGGFDEAFFAHMEEIDLCWRIQRSAREIYYCGESTVFHVGGGTLPKDNPHKTFLNFRNSLAMLYKNLPKFRVIWVLLIRFFLDFLAAMLFLGRGQASDSYAVLRAYIDFYRHLPTWRSKRRAALPLYPQLRGVMPRSLVFQYFVLGKKHFSQLRKYLKA